MSSGSQSLLRKYVGPGVVGIAVGVTAGSFASSSGRPSAPAATALQADDGDLDGSEQTHVVNRPAGRPKGKARPEAEDEAPRDHFAEHQADVSAHGGAARNETWAAEMERRLGEALKSLRTSAVIRPPDCKAESCIVAFSWETREAANQEYANTVHHDYAVPCMTRIVLPPEEPESASGVNATLYFRCEPGAGGN